MPSHQLCCRFDQLREKITQSESRFSRPLGSVKLLAVSKTRSIEEIRAAMQCQQQAFGESYAQELADKANAIGHEAVEWHFIGPIQSNKTRIIAQHAHWVHSIDRLIIAERLAKQRVSSLPPLQVCIQVNIDNESSKSGVSLESLPAFARTIDQMGGLHLRGLMCIPKRQNTEQAQRKPLASLRHALNTLNESGLQLDTLSMGMSNDYPAAIAEGATIVRVGTALFGQRQ